jgi:TolA-binding protein
MRRIHKQVSSLMDKEEVNPEAGLFNTGNYYLKNKRFSQARYVFSRYLTYYPSGRNAALAAKSLETAEIAIARYGDGKGPSVSVSSAPAAAPVGEHSNTAKAYYDAVSLISQEKYQQAYVEFKKIADIGDGSEWNARSSFEAGRCLFFLNRYEDVIKYYTAMLTKYPKHPELRNAMFYIGQSYDKNGGKDQAVAFYKKVLSMPADDDDGTTVKTKRALKAMGVM